MAVGDRLSGHAGPGWVWQRVAPLWGRRGLVAVFGLVVLSVGIGMTIVGDRGVGSFALVETGLAARLGWPLTVVIVLSQMAAVLVAVVAFAQRLGVMVVVNMLVTAPVIGAVVAVGVPVAGWVATLVGSVVIGVGVGLYLAADLGASPYDMLLVGFTQRTGLGVRAGRLIGELTVITGGVVLGGRAGWGTVVTAVLVAATIPFGLAAGRRLAGQITDPVTISG